MTWRYWIACFCMGFVYGTLTDGDPLWVTAVRSIASGSALWLIVKEARQRP